MVRNRANITIAMRQEVRYLHGIIANVVRHDLDLQGQGHILNCEYLKNSES